MAEGASVLWGGIEAGGTKFVCAIGQGRDVVEKTSFSTRAPDETMADVIAFFEQMDQKHRPVQAIGVGSFGPVDVDPHSSSYGQVRSTPKKSWRGYDVVKTLHARLNRPIIFDTDVNAALIGEAKYGAGRDHQDLCYITIGTGIGAGLMERGRLIHGRSHTEIGHIFLRKIDGDEFSGVCPYHGARCAEGLVSGPAIEARAGRAGAQIPDDDQIWPLVSGYIGQLCATIFFTTSPAKIILGGGVMARAHLFPEIQRAFKECIGDYWGARDGLEHELERFIVPVALGGDAGVIGAMAMAAEADGAGSWGAFFTS